MTEFLMEKLVIATSLLLAFPLFFLDNELFGHRRFAWLVAMWTGLATLFFLEPGDEMADLLDKFTMAALSVTAVPHFMRLIKDSPLLGFSTILPIFVIIHLSVETPVGSEAYWRFRAFLHLAVFINPYLNHLPSPPPEEKEATGEELEKDATTEGKVEAVTTTATKSSKSNKTAKHKNKKKN
jgi:hypothetical protein